MIPRILKNFNIFVDGRGFAGIVDDITLPKLTHKTEEIRTAGMQVPVDVKMGLEKLETSMTFADYDADLFKLYGVSSAETVQLTLHGAFEGGGKSQAITVNMVGFIKEFEFGDWKTGEKTHLKVGLSLSYYKLTLDGTPVIEIDAINMIHRINGQDHMATIRSTIGL